MRSFRLRNQRSLRYRFAVLYFTSVWCQWYIPVGFLQFIKLNMFTLSLFGIAVRFCVVYINGFTFLIFSIFKLPSYELHKRLTLMIMLFYLHTGLYDLIFTYILMVRMSHLVRFGHACSVSINFDLRHNVFTSSHTCWNRVIALFIRYLVYNPVAKHSRFILR